MPFRRHQARTWHHEHVETRGRIDVQVTLAEAVTVLHPPISERQLRAIVQALGWRSASHQRGGRGHQATYSWTALADLHQALLPFRQETVYALSGGVCPESGKHHAQAQ
jgi:hypothetical protein